MPYTVLVDSREQIPWKFNKSEYCAGSEITKLETGDYSLKGMEAYFVIERKGTIAEWSQNILEKRFLNELDRLENFPFAFLLLEFDMKDVMNFPYTSSIPHYKWAGLKIKPDFILRKTLELQMKYKTKFIFVGKFGQPVALSLFKRISEYYK